MWKLQPTSSQAVPRREREYYDNAANKRYRQKQKLLLHYKIMFNNHEFISKLYDAGLVVARSAAPKG